MKKALYSTTFLATAGLLALANAGDANAQAAAPAAEKLKISVGGYMTQYVGYAEIDDQEGARARYKHFDQKGDSEIYFTGSVKLDNGWTTSVVVQLEADEETDDGSQAQLDESYMRLQTPFGDIRLGNQDPATQGISVAAPFIGINPYNNDVQRWLPSISLNGISTTSTTVGGGDENRVSYFSPSFAGFRVATSYTPSTTDSFTQPLTTETNTTDIGAQWAGKFGDFGMRVYGAYWRNDASTLTASTNDYSVGADVTFADFTVGGGYRITELRENDVDGADETHQWNLGVRYSPGPFGVALTYMHAENDDTVADTDEDKVQKLQLGASYVLGPGVDLIGNIFWHDYQGEENTPAREATQWAVVTGIQVDF